MRPQYLRDRRPNSRPVALQKKLNRRRRRILLSLSVLFIPLILLVRLIRPLLLIRFGHVLKHKIGHCPLEAELYLLEKKAKIQPEGAVDLFYFQHGTDGQAANMFSMTLAKRSIVTSPLVELLAIANAWVPGGDRHRIAIHLRDTHQLADVDKLMLRVPQQIDLTDQEDALGRDTLAQLGVPRDAKFVCFHVRSPSYWTRRRPGIGSDSDFRNSTIESYFEAMRLAAERGYYVLRVGDPLLPPLPEIHPRVIDYCTRARTEFMDVYLAARCSLMVSTASGIDAVSYMFRRPILYVNVVTWGYMFINMPQPSQCMFKTFMKDGKPMKLEAVVAAGAQGFTTSDQFAAAGITLQENTSEEIAQAVAEMLDGLEGKAVDPQTAELQQRMRAIIDTVPRYADWQFEVPGSYLRKHSELL